MPPRGSHHQGISTLDRCRCNARDWIPCVKHVTWFGVAHFLAGVLAFITTIWGIWTGVFVFGSMTEPWAIVGLCLLSIFLDIYGSWTLFHNSDNHLYAYLVLQYILVSTLFAYTSEMVINVPDAQAYVSNSWYKVQYSVIPFTTQLDTKRYIATCVNVLVWLTTFTAAIHVFSMYRAWSLLGGLQRISKVTYAVWAPISTVIIVIGLECINFSLNAAKVAAFAIQSESNTVSPIPFVGGFGILIVVYACYLLAMHGRSAVAYSLPAVAMWLCSLLALIFGVVAHTASDSIPAFVNEHWPILKQIVYVQYAAERPNVYAQDAASAIKEAAVAAIHLSIHMALMALLYTLVAIECVREDKERLCKLAEGNIAVSTHDVFTAVGEQPAAVVRAPSPRSLEAPLPAGAVAVGVGVGGAPLYGSMTSPGLELTAPLPKTPTFGDSKDSASLPLTSALPQARSGPPYRPPKFNDDGTSASSSDSDTDESEIQTDDSSVRRTSSRSSRRQMSSEYRRSVPVPRYITPEQRQGPAREDSFRKHRFRSEPKLWVVPRPVRRRTNEPLPRVYLRDLTKEVGEVVKVHKIVGLFLLVSLSFVIWGAASIHDTSVCRPVVDSIDNLYVVQSNMSVDVAMHWMVNVDHSFPRGSVTIEIVELQKPGLFITLRVWGTERYPLKLNETYLETIVHVDGEETFGFIDIQVNPPSGSDAWNDCVAAELILQYDANKNNLVDWRMESTSSMLNITGAKVFFPFSTVVLTSIDGPQVLTNIIAWNNTGDGGLAVDLLSESGSISLDTIIAPNITAVTAGNIFASEVLSAKYDKSMDILVQVQGDVTLTALEKGNIYLTRPMGGDNVFVTTHNGEIIVSGATAMIGFDLLFESLGGGDIHVSSFLQAAGNNSYITSNGGKVAVSVMTVNNLEITTSGDVSGVALFLGLPKPTKDFLVDFDSLPDYHEPGLLINGQDGDVTVLVAGSSPLYSNATNYESIIVYTTSGDIKFELNGGGFGGNYSVVSGGSVTVEKDGDPIDISGHIKGTDGIPNLSLMLLESDTGDVDLTLLPSAV